MLTRGDPRYFARMSKLRIQALNVYRFILLAFFQVKLISTRRTIIWLIGGMVVYQIASGFPRNFAIHLTSTISPINNRTVVVYGHDQSDFKLFMTSVFACYSIPTSCLFIVVLIGTIFLINSFKQSRQLRDSMTGSEKSSLSNKDAKLIRLVIFICVFYIVSAAPLVLIFITAAVYPDFNDTNPYLKNFLHASHCIGELSQAFSGSINIVVYFRMGSKYKDTLKKVFLGFSK